MTLHPGYFTKHPLTNGIKKSDFTSEMALHPWILQWGSTASVNGAQERLVQTADEIN